MRQPPTQPKSLGLTVPQSILVRADVLGRFAEHVAKIAPQQGRYAVGHGLSPCRMASGLVGLSIRQRLRASAVQLLRGLGDLAALVTGALQLVGGGLTGAVSARNCRGAVG